MSPCRCLVAALLLAVPWSAAPAAPAFGDQRLFTTAAERARLDELRREQEREPADASEPAEARAPERRVQSEQPPAPPPVDLRGFVRRSEGPGAVWVNDGSTLDDGRLPADIRVHSGQVEGATVRVTLPDGRSIRLKPGQTWDPETGRVVDDYER